MKFFVNMKKKVDDELEPMSFSDIGVLDNNFDELDLTSQKRSLRFETLRNRPFLFGIGLILLIDLIWSRNRLGSLSGGALPIAHGGAADLFSKFAQSWHPVAMGSASPSPTWLEITGIASALTLGNISFFISTLFFLAPAIAFIAMYRSLKRNKLSVRVSSAGGVIYGTTTLGAGLYPVTVGSGGAGGAASTGGTGSNGTNSGIFVTSSGTTLTSWSIGGGGGAGGPVGLGSPSCDPPP